MDNEKKKTIQELHNKYSRRAYDRGESEIDRLAAQSACVALCDVVSVIEDVGYIEACNILVGGKYGKEWQNA